MIAVDTNALIHYFIPGDLSDSARSALNGDPDWRAPPLWASEFCSVLHAHVRRGKLTPEQAREVWTLAAVRMARCEVSVDHARALDLAIASGCSTYDCEFVAVALQTGAPLVTADRQVLARFPLATQRLGA